MKIDKTKTKTTLTVTISISEMRACLEDYQKDVMADLISAEFEGGIPETRQRAIFLATACVNPTKFYELLQMHGMEYPATPKSFTGWKQLFIEQPYLFGITDEVATEDVEVVILHLDGMPGLDVRQLLDNI
jgi:hypothetical protein